MDTLNDCRIPKCGNLPDLRKCTVVVGSKQLRKALVGGRARTVFLAENADPGITEPIEALCREGSVPYAWVPTMAELGSACGIDVGASAAAVVGETILPDHP